MAKKKISKYVKNNVYNIEDQGYTLTLYIDSF
jgi:hypothetical protein